MVRLFFLFIEKHQTDTKATHAWVYTRRRRRKSTQKKGSGPHTVLIIKSLDAVCTREVDEKRDDARMWPQSTHTYTWSCVPAYSTLNNWTTGLRRSRKEWDKKTTPVWKTTRAVSSSAAANKLIRCVIMPLRIIRKSSSNQAEYCV